MAYDRYDTRDNPRDERARWRGERFEGRDRDRDRRDDDRGFFERAGDEVASWFGDEDAERRRHQDRMRDEHEGGGLGRHNEDRGRFFGSDRGRDWHRDRGDEFHSMRSGMHERDRNPEWRRETWGSRDREFDRERGYRPMTGDYGRGELSDYGRPESQYGRDEYRRTSFAGSSMGERDQDPHYRSWRDRHLSELDRDYDEYRREHQSRFEDEFGSWRERRQQKRGLLGQIREHMEVVGNDDQHLGKVDRVAGQVGYGQGRSASFAQLLRHRPGRRRPGDPRLLGRSGAAALARRKPLSRVVRARGPGRDGASHARSELRRHLPSIGGGDQPLRDGGSVARPCQSPSRPGLSCARSEDYAHR